MENKIYTVCSGCGRKFLLSELYSEREEISRENPGIRVNGVGSPFRLISVRYQNVKVCNRCRRYRKITKVISVVSTIIYFLLLCFFTYKLGDKLWWLWGILWFTLSPILFGKLTGLLFGVLTKSDTLCTGDKRYHKEGKFEVCKKCNGTGIYLYNKCSKCGGKGSYTEHYW